MMVVVVVLNACSPQKKELLDNKSNRDVVSDDPIPNPTEPPKETPLPLPPATPGQDSDLKLCSQLDLEGVNWPSELSVPEWTYYALGLNITGSFEGREGWKNIAGNSDGQGMSLGLMQQNLGQGTLQPWLNQMYNLHHSTMVTFFNSQDYRNLKSMLNDWQKEDLTNPGISQTFFDGKLFSDQKILNKLEIGYEDNFLTALNDNSNSVNWAKSNILDSNGKVSARWKKSFQDMAISPGYRSFQLAASTTIFKKAKEYFNYFQFRELRFLLFFFDIVVQNGSISDVHLALYNKWLAKNPNANDQSRALALLEARLTTVRPQYVQDVKSRKTAIIYGTGKVHQTMRNFPQEYCFDPRVIVQ